MTINNIMLENIRSRAEKGCATVQDTRDLLSYIDENITNEDMMSKIETAVERAIDGAISQHSVVNAVERAVRDIRP